MGDGVRRRQLMWNVTMELVSLLPLPKEIVQFLENVFSGNFNQPNKGKLKNIF